MNIVLKKWFKYFLLMSALGILLNILYLSVPLYLMTVYNKVLFSFSKESLFTLTIGLFFALCFYFLIDFIRKYIMVTASENLDKDMAPAVLKNMLFSDYNEKAYSQGLLDLKILKNAISGGKVVNYLDIPWIGVFLAILFYINHIISFIAFSGLAVCVIIYMIFRNYASKRYVIHEIMQNDLDDFIKSSVKKREVLHGLGIVDNISKKYFFDSKEILKKNTQAEKVKSAVSACINFISIISCSGVFCYGAVLFFDSKVTEGTLIGIFVIAMRIFYPLEKVAESSAESIKALAAFKRLNNYILAQPETEKFELPKPEGALSFENVIYSINGKPVLRNISFSLEPGESLVVIGAAGSGKTLLSRLALGIVPPSSGKIRIDGAEISHWDKDELGKYTGYLPSRKLLFEGRVDENISGMAIPDSDKVVKAAKIANAHDMILKLPDGYNTTILEDGYNLASSQVQLISVARAMYDDPKLVVMDCPHNDLDDRALKNFILTMQALKQQKTTIVVVSDRPAIAVNADKILVLQDGQISIFGPAKEVLSKLTNS